MYMRPIHSTKYLYLVQYIVLHCTTGQTGRETGKEGVEGGRCTCRERGGQGGSQRGRRGTGRKEGRQLQDT